MAEPSPKPAALVVDDDLSYRIFMRQILELAGFAVTVETNPRVALRRLRDQPTAVLVTDLFVPEIGGLELIETARGALPGLRIVAVSGGGPRGEAGHLRIAPLFGADATLRKPFNGNELMAAVGLADCRGAG
ncbi:MAG TPA: response regulator [Stellaceae bacterium]|nr:response regulator [Stellaceae bacterium]